MEATFNKTENHQLGVIWAAITEEANIATKGGYVDLVHLATSASALVALCSTVRARTDHMNRDLSLKGRIERIRELQKDKINRE